MSPGIGIKESHGGKESGDSVAFLGCSPGHVGANVTALRPGKPGVAVRELGGRGRGAGE